MNVCGVSLLLARRSILPDNPDEESTPSRYADDPRRLSSGTAFFEKESLPYSDESHVNEMSVNKGAFNDDSHGSQHVLTIAVFRQN